ncbi:MAG: hypothetical protein IPN76_00120 [Saprospiraceae bacterium]|nr:hypothetical protein [Saprospiraceae bacterium]
MDGNAADVCQYTIHVVSVSTEVPIVTMPSTFSGQQNVCLGTAQTYSIAPLVGATFLSGL